MIHKSIKMLINIIEFIFDKNHSYANWCASFVCSTDGYPAFSGLITHRLRLVSASHMGKATIVQLFAHVTLPAIVTLIFC